MEENKKQRIYRTIMCIVITAMITFLITAAVMYKSFKNSLSLINTKTSTSSTLANTLEQFKAMLKEKYIGEIDENSMIESAIKGYISGLGDKYTEYLTKEEMTALKEETSASYVGIGVYLTNDKSTDTILVVGLMEGSPALDAGMQSGDIIEKVNDTEYKGSQIDEAISILKGEENTKVKVTVLRNNQEVELEITRKKIDIKHVGSKMLDKYPNIAYIAIDAFDSGVATEFESQLSNLIEKNDVKGIIIDLRENGGGVVDEATNIADLFIKKGEKILITKNSKDEEEITYSKNDPKYTNIPVVILVDNNTASASEILTAALKDEYSNVTVVGKTTYGKGIIQTLYSLTDGSGIKITTDEYYTPKHNAINGVGITPDYDVDLTKDSNGKYQTAEDNDAQLLKAIEVLNK